MDSRPGLLALVVLTTVACGPARPGLGTSEDGSDSTSAVPETSSDPATTTVVFVPDDDLLRSECDPWLQDCGEGEKCVPYASTGGTWDAHKCVPILGGQAPGEPCKSDGRVEATDDCDATGACIAVDEIDGELIGICWAFCMGTADMSECPEGSKCKLSGAGTLTFCVPSCDPLAQDCGPGQGCYSTGGEFECANATQDIPAGEPCGFINDCAAGHICVIAEVLPSCAGASCCAEFCNLELGDGQCDVVPETSCLPLFEDGEAPPGYELVGVCMLP